MIEVLNAFLDRITTYYLTASIVFSIILLTIILLKGG